MPLLTLAAVRRALEGVRGKAGAIASSVRTAAAAAARPGSIHATLSQSIVAVEQAAGRRAAQRAFREAKHHLSRSVRPQCLTQLPFQTPSEAQLRNNPLFEGLTPTLPPSISTGAFGAWLRRRRRDLSSWVDSMPAAALGNDNTTGTPAVPGVTTAVWTPTTKHATTAHRPKRAGLFRTFLAQRYTALTTPACQPVNDMSPPVSRPSGSEQEGGDGNSTVSLRQRIATAVRVAADTEAQARRSASTQADVYTMRSVDSGWSAWTAPLPVPQAAANAAATPSPTVLTRSSGRIPAAAREGAQDSAALVRPAVAVQRTVASDAPQHVSRASAPNGGSATADGGARARRFTLRGNREGASVAAMAAAAAPTVVAAGRTAVTAASASSAVAATANTVGSAGTVGVAAAAVVAAPVASPRIAMARTVPRPVAAVPVTAAVGVACAVPSSRPQPQVGVGMCAPAATAAPATPAVPPPPVSSSTQLLLATEGSIVGAARSDAAPCAPCGCDDTSRARTICQ